MAKVICSLKKISGVGDQWGCLEMTYLGGIKNHTFYPTIVIQQPSSHLKIAGLRSAILLVNFHTCEKKNDNKWWSRDMWSLGPILLQ